MASSAIKPMKLWGHFGPNPFKVTIILKQLGLPFETVLVDLLEGTKTQEYLAVNPNGRVPSLHDPNTGITLWESGAIIEYLIDKYDQDHKLSYLSTTPEYYLTRQWLYFQTSGQGPYYGQLAWFLKFHPEKIPGAIERYTNQVNRVGEVLDKWLADRDWLVGDRMTYADLAFVSYQKIVSGFDGVKMYPNLKKWLDRMLELDSVKETFAEAEK